MDEDQIHRNLEDYDLKNYKGITEEMKKQMEFAGEAAELGIDKDVMLHSNVISNTEKVNNWIQESENILEDCNK